MERKTLKAWRRLGDAKTSRLVRDYRDEVDQDMLHTPLADESASEEALRNRLILQIIFASIPTNLLVSSCSLVNKSWNSEARKFVRDNRRCTAKNKNTGTACWFLRKFERLCGQIEEQGRIVPFNCLQLNFDRICRRCKCPYEKMFYNDLKSISEFKLKHLEVLVENSMLCSDKFNKTLRSLLEPKGHELQSLKTNSTALFYHYLCNNANQEDWKIPQFPRLETFEVVGVNVQQNPPPQVVFKAKKTTNYWPLQNAPNLKRIVIDDVSALKFIPEEILSDIQELKLNDTFRIDWNGEYEQVMRLRQISQKGSASVRELVINCHKFSHFFPHLQAEEMRRDPVDENLLGQFETALERVLETNHKNLEWIVLNMPYPVARLSHSPLFNLFRLSIGFGKQEYGQFDLILEAIAGIEFERTMPNLEEVQIFLRNGYFWGDLWPTAGIALPPYRCNTARKLELESRYSFNLQPLQAVFPNIIHLSITPTGHGHNDAEVALLKQVWEFWPQLVKLELSGDYYGGSYFPRSPGNIQNYDAEFLGIHEEEAKLLRRRDVKFLRSVHIVPIKSSLLSMSKLRELRINREFFDGDLTCTAIPGRNKRISRVTRLVAFRTCAPTTV